MKFILAIDQSTSATKALLFDRNGGLVDKISIPHQQIYPLPGWVEHDAEEIWQTQLETAARRGTRRPFPAPEEGPIVHRATGEVR